MAQRESSRIMEGKNKFYGRINGKMYGLPFLLFLREKASSLTPITMSVKKAVTRSEDPSRLWG